VSIERVLVAIAVFGFACSDKKSSPPDKPRGSDATTAVAPDAVPWPASAPAIDKCTTHEDCVVITWDAPWPPDPCCDARLGYAPMSRAYVEFMATFRTANCTGVKCPTPPLPGAEPACCASIGRCVKGTCTSACDDPTATGIPDVSVIDPNCRLPAPPPP
jgi:hypothetical protein